MASGDQQVIIHPGIVERIEEDIVFVRVLSRSACSSCSVRGACAISEVEEKIIEVHPHDHRKYKPGDPVTVRMSQGLGSRAVMLGYVIPLVILVASIIAFVLILENEGLAALLAILLLAPYYALLYFLRDKLKQRFSFSIYSED